MTAQVDHGDLFETQALQIGLHTGPQFVRCLSAMPRSLVVSPCPHLGDKDQILGIGMQRFVNELVRNVGSVELSRIYVVDPGVDSRSKDCEGLATVTRRAEDTRARKLHCAESRASGWMPG
jgi:hypothetical protein